MTGASAGGSATDVVADILTDDELLAVLPRPEGVRTLVGVLNEDADPAEIRLLTPEATAKEIRREFVTATHLVDHIEAGTIEMRIFSGAVEPRHTVFIGTERTTSVVWPPGETIAAVTTESEEFRTAVAPAYETMWTDAEEASFYTPGYTRLLQSLSEEFDTEMRDDVADALAAESTKRALNGSLDAVDVMVLVAARHGEQLYELSRWGERVGLASPATFSQAKLELEEQGVIETEKIPVDRGRPRQRLVSGPELPDTQVVEDLITAV